MFIRTKWHTKFQLNTSKHVGEKWGKLWLMDGDPDGRTLPYNTSRLKTGAYIKTPTKPERAPQGSITMTVTFFVMTFDSLTSKCKCTFLSSSCNYVWNMKAIRWKLLKLLCRSQSVDKVPLWSWPLDPKRYRYLPLTILHLSMYEIWKLYVENYPSYPNIASEPRCWQSSVVTLTFENVKVHFSHYLATMYEIWKLYVENYSNYRAITKVLTKFRCDLILWPFDPKMYRYLPLAILHLCMKYESCTLKTTQVIVSDPVLTDRLTDKPDSYRAPAFRTSFSKGSFYRPASRYEIWELYVENYPSYRVRT